MISEYVMGYLEDLISQFLFFLDNKFLINIFLSAVFLGIIARTSQKLTKLFFDFLKPASILDPGNDEKYARELSDKYLKLKEEGILLSKLDTREEGAVPENGDKIGHIPAEKEETEESYTEIDAIKLFNNIKKKYLADAALEIQMRRSIIERDNLGDFYSINYTLRNITERLFSEVKSLERRATLNLYIGCVISFFGLFSLGVIVYMSKSDINNSVPADKVAVDFFMRLSILIVLQVFSYFFLRLYRQNIYDIKIYQNEITNIESRGLAVQVAQLSADKKTLNQIALELSRTERNFILKKNETTVQLRLEELERNQEGAILNRVGKILEKLVPPFGVHNKRD